MMKLKFLTISIFALTASVVSSHAQEYKSVKELREAVRLFDVGMHTRSKTIMNNVAREYGSADAKGYAVLCDVISLTPGYEVRMENFFAECPYSKLVPQIKFRHSLNLFHAGNYQAALSGFDAITPKMLY
jgi:hypothetical protein